MSVKIDDTLISVSQRHVLVVIVENEPGVLARVVGLISGRGYNIESLTVSTVNENKSVSRINLVTIGDKSIVLQIKAQLLRLIPVHSVTDVALDINHIEKETLLIKVFSKAANRRESLRIADIFNARAVDTTLDSFVFSLTGSSAKLESFVLLMQSLGEIEIAKSGIVAMSRGKITESNNNRN